MSYNAEIQSNNADLQTILDKVNALPEAGSGEAAEPVIEALEVTANGTYEAPSGTDGYNPVVVNVPVPDGYIQPSGSVTITKNGTHDVTEYASAEVNVPSEEPVLQEKTAAPSTAEQTVTPDDGYDGLSKVTIEAMPTAAQATPIITVSSSGRITAKANQAAGYVSAGSKSATKQLTTKGATTITPTDTEQTAVPAGTYVTGDIKVAAVSGGGGSGSVETVTLTVDVSYTGTNNNARMYYPDHGTGKMVRVSLDNLADTTTYTLRKGDVVAIALDYGNDVVDGAPDYVASESGDTDGDVWNGSSLFAVQLYYMDGDTEVYI